MNYFYLYVIDKLKVYFINGRLKETNKAALCPYADRSFNFIGAGASSDKSENQTNHALLSVVNKPLYAVHSEPDDLRCRVHKLLLK
ncbi:hypothetical protein [Mucilaginibacter sp. L3T2-6]|uniref:hypothetical protein n=1 Tax=Mucilaginibacter sp. L3T2-6 TaxID=3062491 RepID=UPI0026774FC7|nr:hypothetical protein [Mucilaginibacter sp. L3T2-6]MDO3645324.1 hypothetical protein [Mucilaginibacter sp. L3T2-6]MDV6217823.1 hypothetical protein [Mucilaginibacter sp. L3T2-6]